MTIQTINPATGQVIQSYDEMSSAQVNGIINDVHDAHQQWRNSDFSKRRQQLLALADLLQQRAQDFANIITQEMGKPISQARAEVDKCVALCEYYAQHAEAYLSPRQIDTHYSKSYVSYEPLGVVFAIMPWNYPLWQVMRFLAPTLMTGNAAILSHAPISTGCALMIEQLVADAGYLSDLFRVVVVDNDVAAEIIRHPQVSGVALTGSERAGRAVASEAGSALKHVVLELGGSDPYLILDDADIEQAAEICVTSRLNNAGQVCIAAKRMIVVDSVADAFKQAVIKKAKTYVPGDPSEPQCNMGPIARADLRAELHQQVQTSITQGAQLLCGGEMPEGEGFYYPVTILDGVKPGISAYSEELFGPVISFITANDEAHAIEIANSLSFGLGAAVFTQDLARGERIAREQLQAGTCVVNTLVTSHFALPFGGIKNSGIGRELSAEGIHEFVNIKTVCIA